MRETWKTYLQKQARLHRMCADNRAYLNACETKGDAIRLYKQTIDWALEENYPDLDFLRKEFNEQENDGIYIDRHFEGEVLNEHQVYVFHHCTGYIRVGLNPTKKIIPMCYFANGCDMNIDGIKRNLVAPDYVPLYIFGDNNITSNNTDYVTFKIYKKEI